MYPGTNAGEGTDSISRGTILEWKTCKKLMEAMDSLVDCTPAELELGWKQPNSLAESYEKYGNIKHYKPCAQIIF